MIESDADSPITLSGIRERLELISSHNNEAVGDSDWHAAHETSIMINALVVLIKEVENET